MSSDTLYVLAMFSAFTFPIIVEISSALQLSNVVVRWSFLSKTKEISNLSNYLFAASKLIV